MSVIYSFVPAVQAVPGEHLTISTYNQGLRVVMRAHEVLISPPNPNGPDHLLLLPTADAVALKNALVATLGA